MSPSAGTLRELALESKCLMATIKEPTPWRKSLPIPSICSPTLVMTGLVAVSVSLAACSPSRLLEIKYDKIKNCFLVTSCIKVSFTFHQKVLETLGSTIEKMLKIETGCFPLLFYWYSRESINNCRTTSHLVVGTGP